MIRTTLRQHSSKSAQKEAYRRKCRAIVVTRAKGHCEAPLCKRRGEEWHHLFGRGRSVISEPLASSPECTVMLCQYCHRETHANPTGMVVEDLRAWSISELRQRHLGVILPVNFTYRDLFGDSANAIDAARHIERWLKDQGIMETLW